MEVAEQMEVEMRCRKDVGAVLSRSHQGLEDGPDMKISCSRLYGMVGDSYSSCHSSLLLKIADIVVREHGRREKTVFGCWDMLVPEECSGYVQV